MSLTQITTGGVDDNINIDSNTLKVDGTNNRVGIGTAAPNENLHISEANGGGDVTLRIQNDSDTDSGTTASIRFTASSTDTFNTASIIVDRNTRSIAFDTIGNERLRIDSSGFISQKFTSNNSSTPEGLFINNQNNGTGNNASLIFSNDSGNRKKVAIAAVDVGNYGASDLVFALDAADSGEVSLSTDEKMRIDSSGRLLIGGSSAISGSNANDNLQLINSAGSILSIASSDTTIGNGTRIGEIEFWGQPGSTWGHFASITVKGDASAAANDNPGRIQFSTTADGATTPTERMRLGSDGKLLIGSDTGSVHGDRLLQVGKTDRGQTYISITSSTSGYGGIVFADTTTNDTGGYRGIVEYQHNNDAMVFSTSATERMRIDSSGRVGIKNSSPGSQYFNDLVIGDGSGDHGITLHTSTTGSSSIAFSDATSGSGRYAGYLQYDHSDNSMKFYTNGGNERMRIGTGGMISALADAGWESEILYNKNSAGSVRSFIIGRHSATALTGASGTAGTISFKVTTNGNVTNTNNSYGQISDVKLKENIVSANSQWDDIKSVQVRNFNFKEETGNPTHTQIGVVAQEIETVSPGLISESPDFDDDGNDLGTVTKSVNYSVLYMKAVKALQEAMDRIETLETKVAALEAAE